MPQSFNFKASPFDSLNPEEQALVQARVDIGYHAPGSTILEVGDRPQHLHIIIKGHVQQYDEAELVATLGPDDCFDGRGLVAGRVSSRFVAADEVLTYQLAHEAVSQLIARNATFGALLFSDLSDKLGALSQRQSQHELHSLVLARVDQAFVRPALWVDGETDIVEVVRQFSAHRTATVLVRDARQQPPALGIFTTTGLQRAILHGTPLDRLSVRELANFDLICVRPSDPLGDALAVMIQHKVHRVVVAEDGQIHGVLEALDLFSYLSNQSYLIHIQMLQAQDLVALQAAAARIQQLVALLYRGGTRVAQIARLVQALNARLFERAWQLLAPPELQAHSCLIVMGSEGRGEQLLRTDQDNGLILQDGYTPPDDLDRICSQFSQALADFGYPPCPGQVMLSNPAWRLSVSAFRQRVHRWWTTPGADHLMNLAIVMDAHAVAGDAGLLTSVRSSLLALAADHDTTLARFAAAVQMFDHLGGTAWWHRLWPLGDHPPGAEALDLKKAGIFPIVHGVRSLALAHQVDATSTSARIEALRAQGVLDATLATDLADSLQVLMGLKLKLGLLTLETGAQAAPQALSSLDRDLLKDALAVVKRLRLLLNQRFHLESL